MTLTLLLDYLINEQWQSCNGTDDIQAYCPVAEISFSFCPQIQSMNLIE